MDFEFSKHLLVRSPVKSPADYGNNVEAFLNDLHFRAALLVASPSFYETLKRQDFNVQLLTPKEVLTLKKYINRYCFRPTPFGLFASVGLTTWAILPDQSSGHIFRAHTRADMALVSQLSGRPIAAHDFIELNPFFYRTMDEYRFLSSSIDEMTGQREYQLQSIAYSPILYGLVQYGKKERTLAHIITLISNSAHCTTAEAEDYARFLVSAQFFVPTLRLNITGQDYLERLFNFSDHTSPEGNFKKEYHLLTGAGNLLPVPEVIQRKNEVLRELIPGKGKIDSPRLNVILQRLEIGQPAIEVQEKLRYAINGLDLISPREEIPAMNRFIQEFQQQFELQMIPLLAALDPETGVGYQSPEMERHNPLLETLQVHHQTNAQSSVPWSEAHALLLEAWHRDRSPIPVIKLTEADLKELRPKRQSRLTLGLSVLFRQVHEQILLESAGGVNAPALMGRFTVIDEGIKSAAQEMARHLETRNPDFIFAELLHLSAPHTDNVNRREHLYAYELPITASSSLPKEQQIELSDLFVSIQDNVAILYSKKHQKVVIPRLTSAYNHSLNKLPLFRFLADLPYQYSRYNLGFDLRQYFPNLPFYPRVEIGDTIVSLATWIVNAQTLTTFQQRNDAQTLQSFRVFAVEVQLPRYFTLSESDQELVFDHSSEPDILFFCDCIRQKKEVILKEYIRQNEVRQYNAFVLPTEPLTLSRPSIDQAHTPKVKRQFIPGSEWLYLKIYMPKAGANGLLLKLKPLLKRKYRQQKIGKWFFIRYEDPAPHIRLRLLVAPESISEVLIAFKTKLEGPARRHVIREYRIDTYSRELERYRFAGMELTEQFFHASSELVLAFLTAHKKGVAVSLHLFALYSLKHMVSEFFKGLDDQITFTLNSFQQFQPEFSGNIKVELDKKYRELGAGIRTSLEKKDPALLSGSVMAGNAFVKTFEEIIENLTGTNVQKLNYLQSLIHMHLNRLFSDDSRKQEMSCYYLLYKSLLSDKGRMKNKSLE